MYRECIVSRIHIALSHLVLSVCKCCKLGQNPLDKPGQRTSRKKEEGLMHSSVYTWAYSSIHIQTYVVYSYTSTCLVNLAALCVCVSLFCLFCLWLSYPHSKTELFLHVNTHQRRIQLTDNRTKTSLKENEGWWNEKGRGAFCFDVKSFSFLSVLGQVHCHHNSETWIENTEPA